MKGNLSIVLKSKWRIESLVWVSLWNRRLVSKIRNWVEVIQCFSANLWSQLWIKTLWHTLVQCVLVWMSLKRCVQHLSIELTLFSPNYFLINSVIFLFHFSIKLFLSRSFFNHFSILICLFDFLLDLAINFSELF